MLIICKDSVSEGGMITAGVAFLILRLPSRSAKYHLTPDHQTQVCFTLRAELLSRRNPEGCCYISPQEIHPHDLMQSPVAQHAKATLYLSSSFLSAPSHHITHGTAPLAFCSSPRMILFIQSPYFFSACSFSPSLLIFCLLSVCLCNH